jgi:phage terminase Nu1 subunit (DNA packaging protein)
MQKYTRKAVAAICGVTPPRIGQLVNDGVIDRNANGSYSETAITQYIEFLRKSREEKSKYRDLLEQEKYREKKRQNDQAEALVAPVDLLEDAVVRGVSAMVPVLEGLPLLMKRHWPEISGDQIQLVKRSVAECRNALADVEITFDD